MFQVGDKIVYPVFGTCIIDAVEEKEILGEKKLFYIVNITKTRMQISVPIDKATRLGIRLIVEPEVLESVLNGLNLGDTDPVIFENKRFCTTINTQKIKTGDIFKGTEVIRDLTRKGKRSKLGIDDSKMLINARQVFLSELMEVKSIEEEQAILLLDESLCSG
ncbi:MAG: CarD family transcriptional regulator [Desulfitobacterium sp.]